MRNPAARNFSYTKKSNSRERIPAVAFFRENFALRLGQNQSLQTRVEAALVAGDGVVMENALLHALVEGGDGRAILLLGGLHVALA